MTNPNPRDPKYKKVPSWWIATDSGSGCVAGVDVKRDGYGDTLGSLDDYFSFRDVGDVAEDLYLQCVVWGATQAKAEVGPKGVFMVVLHKLGSAQHNVTSIITNSTTVMRS